jgi:hypothetical protein
LAILIGFSACQDNEAKEDESIQENAIEYDKPSENEIKKGLLDKSVYCSPSGRDEDKTKWTFVDLSEFLAISIIEKTK